MGTWGMSYAEVLLSRHRSRELLERSDYTLTLAVRSGRALDIGLAELNQARAQSLLDSALRIPPPAFTAALHKANNDLAVLDAEISPTLDTFRTACAQVSAEGWWHLMPRLESLVAAQPKGGWFRSDPRKPWDQLLAPLRAAEKTYHAERDAYLRKEAEGDSLSIS